jgi:hypothetical protein
MPAPLWRRASLVARTVKHVLPPTIFFFFGFNLILFTLDDAPGTWHSVQQFLRRAVLAVVSRSCWWSTTCASCVASMVRR